MTPQEMGILIEDQTKELTERANAIKALQRNFESLSDFYKSEKMKSKTLVQEMEDLKKENGQLQQRLKEQSVVKKQQKKSEDSDSPTAKPKASQADFDGLRDQNSSLHKALQNKTSELERAEEFMRKLKIEKEKLVKDVTLLKDKMTSKDKHVKDCEQQLAATKVLLKHDILQKLLADVKAEAAAKDKLLEVSAAEKAGIVTQSEQIAQQLKLKDSMIEAMMSLAIS
jgi:hypothetical protein